MPACRNGRRGRLKICCGQPRAGSSPAAGMKKAPMVSVLFWYMLKNSWRELMESRIRKVKRFAVVGIAALSVWMMPVPAKAAERETKIHFISLNNSTDAILLESNGHYGLVDSGEDWDYPDGTDNRYPLRDDITRGIGYEQQVIHYLKNQGVEKLEFYIATHSHSDHIGSGNEILDAFPTDRLYINQYDDSYIIKENDSHLWDNQYVYDDIIEAAKRNGTEIIKDLDLEENAEYRSFTLGDMSIDLLNLERRRDENGQIIPDRKSVV